MAFVKRTWLARIGTGLNKFIIGEKDANDKQTLVNSPDSVTQQGDVISADNLNDLEDRIEDGFDGKQDVLTFDDVPTLNSNNPVKSSGIAGMRLTKIWENPNPSSDFGEQTITLQTEVAEIMIEVRPSKDYATTEIKHFKGYVGASSNYVVHDLGHIAGIAGNVLLAGGRRFGFGINGGTTSFKFQAGYYIYASNNSPVGAYDNGRCIPVAIYKVGDIYNS